MLLGNVKKRVKIIDHSLDNSEDWINPLLQEASSACESAKKFEILKHMMTYDVDQPKVWHLLSLSRMKRLRKELLDTYRLAQAFDPNARDPLAYVLEALNYTIEAHIQGLNGTFLCFFQAKGRAELEVEFAQGVFKNKFSEIWEPEYIKRINFGTHVLASALDSLTYSTRSIIDSAENAAKAVNTKSLEAELEDLLKILKEELK